VDIGNFRDFFQELDIESEKRRWEGLSGENALAAFGNVG